MDSWSPRNVLVGTMHPAKFLKNGQVGIYTDLHLYVTHTLTLSHSHTPHTPPHTLTPSHPPPTPPSQVVEIPPGGAILETAENESLFPDLPMESYPNRDSVKYRDVYNIPEAHTIVRGTLRYPGFCGLVLGLQRLGLLRETEHQRLQPDAAPLRWVGLCSV